jgi:hypothetical protein
MKDYKHLQYKCTVSNKIKSAVIAFSSLLSIIVKLREGVEWLENFFGMVSLNIFIDSITP